MKTSVPFVEKVRSSWGKTSPEWVNELARLADQRGLKGAGERIKYSTTAVSSVLSNNYRGNIQSIEEAVRGALMGLKVQCPVQGEIGRHNCLEWQSLPYGASDSMRIRTYHACRGGCQHSHLKQRGVQH